MSRFNAAIEAWLRAIRSATIAGSVSIGAGGRRAGAAGRWPAWGLVGERRDEVAAIEDGLQRVPDQRIALPHDLQEARPASPAKRGAR